MVPNDGLFGTFSQCEQRSGEQQFDAWVSEPGKNDTLPGIQSRLMCRIGKEKNCGRVQEVSHCGIVGIDAMSSQKVPGGRARVENRRRLQVRLVHGFLRDT